MHPYSFTYSLFVGNFALNYPVLNIACSILHGVCLSVCYFATKEITYSVSGVHKAFISDESVTHQTGYGRRRE